MRRKLCPFQRPKDAGSVTCTGHGLEKDVATTAKKQQAENPVGQPSKSSSTPKIIISAHLPLEQLTGTLEESDTMLEKFPKHEVPMGLDANAKLAGHTNGFSVGDAVPNSDVMAGNEERTTFFLNFMTKNGLVAQNSWTATAAPQEDMYTRREWDEHEILGNLAVGTQAQRKGSRYEATKPTAFPQRQALPPAFPQRNVPTAGSIESYLQPDVDGEVHHQQRKATM